MPLLKMFDFLKKEQGQICSKPCSKLNVEIGNCICHHLQYQKEHSKQDLEYYYLYDQQILKDQEINKIINEFNAEKYKKKQEEAYMSAPLIFDNQFSKLTGKTWLNVIGKELNNLGYYKIFSNGITNKFQKTITNFSNSSYQLWVVISKRKYKTMEEKFKVFYLAINLKTADTIRVDDNISLSAFEERVKQIASQNAKRKYVSI